MPAIRDIITITPIQDEPDYVSLNVVPPSTMEWGPDEHFALFVEYLDSAGGALSGGSCTAQMIDVTYAGGNSVPTNFPPEENPFSVGPYMRPIANSATLTSLGSPTIAFNIDADLGDYPGGNLGFRFTDFQATGGTGDTFQFFGNSQNSNVQIRQKIIEIKTWVASS